MGIVTKILLSCQNATFLVSKKQETKLSFIESIQLKAHLSLCDICSNFKIQTDALTLGLKKKGKIMESNKNDDLSDAKKADLQELIIENLKKK